MPWFVDSNISIYLGHSVARKRRLQFFKDTPGFVGVSVVRRLVFMRTVDRGDIVTAMRRILELPLHPGPDLGSVRSRRENNQ